MSQALRVGSIPLASVILLLSASLARGSGDAEPVRWPALPDFRDDIVARPGLVRQELRRLVLAAEELKAAIYQPLRKELRGQRRLLAIRQFQGACDGIRRKVREWMRPEADGKIADFCARSQRRARRTAVRRAPADLPAAVTAVQGYSLAFTLDKPGAEAALRSNIRAYRSRVEALFQPKLRRGLTQPQLIEALKPLEQTLDRLLLQQKGVFSRIQGVRRCGRIGGKMAFYLAMVHAARWSSHRAFPERQDFLVAAKRAHELFRAFGGLASAQASGARAAAQRGRGGALPPPRGREPNLVRHFRGMAARTSGREVLAVHLLDPEWMLVRGPEEAIAGKRWRAAILTWTADEGCRQLRCSTFKRFVGHGADPRRGHFLTPPRLTCERL